MAAGARNGFLRRNSGQSFTHLSSFAFVFSEFSFCFLCPLPLVRPLHAPTSACAPTLTAIPLATGPMLLCCSAFIPFPVALPQCELDSEGGFWLTSVWTGSRPLCFELLPHQQPFSAQWLFSDQSTTFPIVLIDHLGGFLCGGPLTSLSCLPYEC